MGAHRHLTGRISVLAVVIPLALLHAYQQNPNTPNLAAGGTGPQSFSVGPDALLALKEQGGNISVFPSNTNTITIEPRNHGTVVTPNPQSVKILYSRALNAQGHDLRKEPTLERKELA